MSATSSEFEPTGLALYTRAARESSAQVIAAYSTSFGWATKLLEPAMRQPVRDIYAMVRVADEIVDGPAREAGADAEAILDAFEAETYRAIEAGFSANLTLHAFAQTARQYGIGRDLIGPFFASMRADLTESTHTQESFERYIYGSAEVIGLMCLKIFVAEAKRSYSTAEIETLERGACALGSAFQKVNFLRDISADFNRLGRSYFPGVTPTDFDNAKRDEIVADIAGEIETARLTLELLPAGARKAVRAALLLFASLNRAIAATEASKLSTTRIRVSDARKLFIVIRAMG
jgi:phytoene synthase